MEVEANTISDLYRLKGKTIAIVYIFEKEDAKGFQHYWVWKSDIIAGWMKAVQEIGCIPFILDVRTFIQKAIYRDLPQIDYVLNLNCGNSDLSVMPLVPAMCSFLSIPCIPCNAASIVISENKAISNTIARSYLNVPKDLDWKKNTGIYRPLNLGSSIGVTIGNHNCEQSRGTYQEFIPGYDITIPLMYNPCIHQLDMLPPIIYIPHNLDPKWIYDEQEKINDNSFSTYPILQIDADVKRKIIDFAKAFPITSYGRIDMRLRTTEETLSNNIIHNVLHADDLFFVEINSMPTIETEDSFEYAMKTAQEDRTHSLYTFINSYHSIFPNASVNGLLLASAILSLKAMY